MAVAFLQLLSLVGSLLSKERWFHAVAIPSGGFVAVQGLWAAETAILTGQAGKNGKSATKDGINEQVQGDNSR